MTNLVAVYGTLRKDQRNFQFMELDKDTPSKFMGLDEALGFTMFPLQNWKETTFPNSYPYLMRSALSSSVEIEVYQVSDLTMMILDKVEGYPALYTRDQIPTKYGPAWIYHTPHHLTDTPLEPIGRPWPEWYLDGVRKWADHYGFEFSPDLKEITEPG